MDRLPGTKDDPGQQWRFTIVLVVVGVLFAVTYYIWGGSEAEASKPKEINLAHGFSAKVWAERTGEESFDRMQVVLKKEGFETRPVPYEAVAWPAEVLFWTEKSHASEPLFLQLKSLTFAEDPGLWYGVKELEVLSGQEIQRADSLMKRIALE